MKNWRLKFLVVSVACVLAVVAVKYLPALLCGGGESEVYHRYEHRDDLKVGFVKDYRIDDSTTVDVTTLTAKDSASWENLLREMNYPEMLIKIMNENLRNGNRGVGNYYCKKGLPETRTKIDVPNSQLVIVSPFEKCFYIFDVISKEQAHLIMDFEREDIIHQKK